MITGTANDETITITLTDGSESSGTGETDVLYTEATGGLEDIAGNPLADVASGDVNEQDDADPIILSLSR